jgi:thioredoxin
MARVFKHLFMVLAFTFSLVTLATASEFTDYEPGLIKDKLAAGETVFVDYSADWCGTCRAQERAVTALLKENSAYAANISFVRVDWDKFAGHEVSTSRNIPRRSTLILLRKDQELDRLVAITGKEAIKDMLDKAL